jgi:manganese efflux pump family protein
MSIAALITWIITAGGGFVLASIWLARRGAAQRVPASTDAGPVDTTTRTQSRLPTPLVFGHAGLAVVGLVLWIIYLANDSDTLARVTSGVVLVVALLGFTMLARWLRGGGPQHADADTHPENNFPLPVVAAHGLFAATTLVLVLLAAFRS